MVNGPSEAKRTAFLHMSPIESFGGFGDIQRRSNLVLTRAPGAIMAAGLLFGVHGELATSTLSTQA